MKTNNFYILFADLHIVNVRPNGSINVGGAINVGHKGKPHVWEG